MNQKFKTKEATVNICGSMVSSDHPKKRSELLTFFLSEKRHRLQQIVPKKVLIGDYDSNFCNKKFMR